MMHDDEEILAIARAGFLDEASAPVQPATGPSAWASLAAFRLPVNT
ncbi:MAG: hypothetical protein U5L74_08685 [Ideonella sp.]|nr:hypothetical protein [Ideonella sp.]